MTSDASTQLLCYREGDCRLTSNELHNVARVASWLCNEMTVWRIDRWHNLALWRVDCVTTWQCDELTGIRFNNMVFSIMGIVSVFSFFWKL